MTEQLNNKHILVYSYFYEFILFFPKLPFLSRINFKEVVLSDNAIHSHQRNNTCIMNFIYKAGTNKNVIFFQL